MGRGGGGGGERGMHCSFRYDSRHTVVCGEVMVVRVGDENIRVTTPACCERSCPVLLYNLRPDRYRHCFIRKLH